MLQNVPSSLSEKILFVECDMVQVMLLCDECDDTYLILTSLSPCRHTQQKIFFFSQAAWPTALVLLKFSIILYQK